MKNNIAKIVHSWSSNFFLIGCLVVVLVGTSEWLMHCTNVQEETAVEEVEIQTASTEGESILTKFIGMY